MSASGGACPSGIWASFQLAADRTEPIPLRTPSPARPSLSTGATLASPTVKIT